MALHLTNTLTKTKEPFAPMQPPKVTLYVCGVTVYDDCHVGHARGAIVFDMLRRFLEYSGYDVQHVRNITDVDDKIIQRARDIAQDGESLNDATRRLTEKHIQSFHDDFDQLNLLPPHAEPKATEYIEAMQMLIQQLIEQGMAYEAADGVYFAVRKLENYGQLSHQDPDQMLENNKPETGDGKQDALDFALWKKAKPEEPAWDSPWGAGRPGWHIECTTMSTDILGESFDIHGGGRDLIFPHHENELAQALGVDRPFAKLWMHNGLLTIEDQKMAKSLGNIVSLKELLSKHSGDVLRLFFLSAHYRSPVSFSWDRFDEVASGYDRFLDFFAKIEQHVGAGESVPDEAIDAARQKFLEAMEDDLNTPEALAALYELVSQAFVWLNEEELTPHNAQRLRGARDAVYELGQVLGFRFEQEVPEEILALVQDRQSARASKDFSRADEIRDMLQTKGYIVEDVGGETVVRKKA